MNSAIVLTVVFFAVPSISTKVKLGSCSLHCDEHDSVLENILPSRRYNGGPRGQKGEQGDKGEMGLPGLDCTCPDQTNLATEIETLKTDFADFKFQSQGWVAGPINLQYRIVTQYVNYQDAKSYCQSLGARLASTGLRNETTRRQVTQILNGVHATWIGLDDIQKEGTYMWSDGSVKQTRRHWNSGEPNNVGYGEDCIVLFEKSRGVMVMNDVPCSDRVQVFLCEREIGN